MFISVYLVFAEMFHSSSYFYLCRKRMRTSSCTTVELILQPAQLQLMSVDILVDISVPAAEIQIRAESLEMNPA